MTEKKRGFIYLSILPVVLIVIIIGIAGYLLLADEIKLPNFDNKPKPRRLAGFPTVIYTDKPIERKRLVITNETELNNYLNNIDSTGLLILRDKVDFSKEVILAANSQVRTADKTTLKIKKVYEDTAHKKIIVEIHEALPTPECEETTDAHVGVDLVAFSKTDYKIEFDRVQDTLECRKESSSSSGSQKN